MSKDRVPWYMYMGLANSRNRKFLSWDTEYTVVLFLLYYIYQNCGDILSYICLTLR